MRNVTVSVITDIYFLRKEIYIMVENIITSICFFCLGFISKELVLYGIIKAKKADKQIKLAKSIISNRDKIMNKKKRS